MVFPWLFRGPLLSRKTVFGPFSWFFRGFFVVPILGKIYAYSPWNSLLMGETANKRGRSAQHLPQDPPKDPAVLKALEIVEIALWIISGK